MKIEIILNLKERIVVDSINEAVVLHCKYRDDNNIGSRDMYNSIILKNNVVSNYISYNGRVWDWGKEGNPYMRQTDSRKEMLKYFK